MLSLAGDRAWEPAARTAERTTRRRPGPAADCPLGALKSAGESRSNGHRIHFDFKVESSFSVQKLI